LSKPSASVAAPVDEAPLVIEASEALPPGSRLLGRNVDRPTPGTLEGDLLISGWALSETGPLERVLAIAGERRLAHVRAERTRQDIGEAFPDLDHAEQSGFRIRIPASVARHLKELEIAVEVLGGEVIPIWQLRLAHAAAPSEPDPPARSRARPRWHRRRGAAVEDGERSMAPPSAAVLDDSFRVIAIISVFNEADIIEPVLDHLTSNGIWSYLIDNGSTDETVAAAARWLGRGLLGIEKLANPADGKTSWRAILARKLELARELGADWYLHHDADEIRESPWPNLSLRDAIHWVDRLGYNAIDFRVLNFPPVDDIFRPGTDPRTHFVRWEEAADYDRMQRKCWKAGFPDVSLDDGGHDVRFAARRLFPVRFLLRHYPIRSQVHGARKVLEERKGRFAADEIAFGWHRQYDHVSGRDQLFVRNPASLRPFDLDQIRLETMLEGRENGATPSEPGTAPERSTETVRGFLDRVSPTMISGWAVREDNEESVTVQLWDGGRVFATIPAADPRPDLAAHGIGGGLGGFSLRPPKALLDGDPHWIWATVAGTDVALRRSPLVLHAGGRISIGPPGPPIPPTPPTIHATVS
jgi:hypothetical protein